ncbi:hypothetical protein D3C79_659530 [compost metagenome]
MKENVTMNENMELITHPPAPIKLLLNKEKKQSVVYTKKMDSDVTLAAGNITFFRK